MRIEYIAHACLLVDTGNEKILLDPWITGPAFNNQWHLFPKPVNIEKLYSGIDYILFTHGHEDHLHEKSLALLPKTAKIYYPYTWYGNSAPYFNELGFKHASEAISWKRIHISANTYVTYISHNLDSIIVIEANGKILVDINDALPAHNNETILFFTRKIKEKWGKIDYIFSGFGGASYFPNTIHAPFKNDLEIGLLREQLFIENFFLIINELSPKIAIPFAADFVLLDKENRWTNRIKDSKEELIEKYYSYFPEMKGKVMIESMYPGDILEKDIIEKNSGFHKVPKSDYEKIVEKEYADIIKDKEEISYITPDEADQLSDAIQKQIVNRKNKLKFYADKMRDLHFDIKVIDVKEMNYFNVNVVGDNVIVKRNTQKHTQSPVQINMRSSDLLYSFKGDWTGDVINIGYGLQVYVDKEEYVNSGILSVCLKLLTNHPNEDHYITKPSYRALKFIWANPIHRDWFMKKITKSKSGNLREALYLNDNTYNQSVWLTKNKCQICEICKLPNRDK